VIRLVGCERKLPVDSNEDCDCGTGLVPKSVRLCITLDVKKKKNETQIVSGPALPGTSLSPGGTFCCYHRGSSSSAEPKPNAKVQTKKMDSAATQYRT